MVINMRNLFSFAAVTICIVAFFTKALLAQNYDGKIITLENLGTAMFLDSRANRSVYTNKGNGGNYQKWVLKASDSGTYTFTNLATGLRLDSNERGEVYAFPANDGNFQKWEIIKDFYGAHTLKNLATKLFLDSNQSGKVYTLSKNGSNNQVWYPAITSR